jgi:hypothetical protein
METLTYDHSVYTFSSIFSIHEHYGNTITKSYIVIMFSDFFLYQMQLPSTQKIHIYWHCQMNTQYEKSKYDYLANSKCSDNIATIVSIVLLHYARCCGNVFYNNNDDDDDNNNNILLL